MVDIAINDVPRRNQYTGNTGLGPFAFTFNCLEETDVAVYKNDIALVYSTEYTVSISGDGTGSITLTGAGNGTDVIISDVVTLVGDRAVERTTDFANGATLSSAALNEQFDSLVMLIQQIDEKVTRAVRSPVSDVVGDFILPAVSDRAGRYLSFNATTGEPEALESIAERITISTLSPSGGTDGDLWFKLSS